MLVKQQAAKFPFDSELGLLRIGVVGRVAPFCSEFPTPELVSVIRSICRVKFCICLDDRERVARLDYFESHFPNDPSEARISF